LQTGKHAIGLPEQPNVGTPIEGRKMKNDKGISQPGPFEIYVLCNGLITGLCNALLDIGSKVSLIKEGTLITG